MGEPSLSKEVDALIGRSINDRFEIISLIARGGMGRVYRARQQPLGRLVALKVLDPRQHKGAEDPDFQARFFLEASTSAKLSHPNTVTVFDYGKTDDGIFYIVMELVEGRTLAQILKEQAPIDPQRAVHMAVQIARSLREAHSLGVIHRDLKPANVLMTKHADEDDFAKVLDFGLVKNVADDVELTQAGLFMGSPKYMAPEQIQGGEVDQRTDIYALGCILFYMLVGRVPYDRENQVQILMAHCREAVPPMIRDDGVSIPQGLVAVTMRCLAKEKEQRFATMNDVITALKHAGSAAGVTITTSGSHTLTDIDLSGMRALPGRATPSGGVDRSHLGMSPAAGVPTIPPFQSESGSMSLAFDVAAPAPEPKSKAPAFLAVAVIAILAGGGSAWLASRANQPRASNDPVPRDTAPADTATPQTPEVGAAPAAAATPIEPTVNAHVVVAFRSTPSGAEVFVGDRAYGSTPAEVEWVGEQAQRGREVTVRFVKPGYRPFSVTRTIDGDRLEITADLALIPTTTGRPSGSMSDSPMVDRPAGRSERFLDNPY